MECNETKDRFATTPTPRLDSTRLDAFEIVSHCRRPYSLRQRLARLRSPSPAVARPPSVAHGFCRASAIVIHPPVCSGRWFVLNAEFIYMRHCPSRRPPPRLHPSYTTPLESHLTMPCDVRHGFVPPLPGDVSRARRGARRRDDVAGTTDGARETPTGARRRENVERAIASARVDGTGRDGTGRGRSVDGIRSTGFGRERDGDGRSVGRGDARSWTDSIGWTTRGVDEDEEEDEEEGVFAREARAGDERVTRDDETGEREDGVGREGGEDEDEDEDDETRRIE